MKTQERKWGNVAYEKKEGSTIQYLVEMKVCFCAEIREKKHAARLKEREVSNEIKEHASQCGNVIQ